MDRGANYRLTLGFSEHADDISSILNVTVSFFFQIFYILFYKRSFHQILECQENYFLNPLTPMLPPLQRLQLLHFVDWVSHFKSASSSLFWRSVLARLSHCCKAPREKILERIMRCEQKISWWICTFSSFFIPRLLVLWARFARRGCWASYHLVENNPLQCLKVDLYTHIISSNNSCSYDSDIALNNSNNDILVNNFNQTNENKNLFTCW